MIQLTESGAVCSNCQNVLTRHYVVSPSPVPSLLHTNQIPSLSDASLIRKALSKVDLNLSQINSDINQVQLVLDRLQQNCYDLGQYHRDHKALISPIRCFPPEILSHIFLLSLPTPDYDDRSIMVLRKAVMFPGQVCKYWREIALSTPKMWSKITFLSESDANAKLTYSWLSRSGSSPLSICLSNRISLDANKPTSPVLLDVIAQSDRWKDLVYKAGNASIVGLPPVRHRLPYLQTLSIANGTFIPLTQTLDIFEIAPRLHSLTLGHNISLTELRIPWNQLTYCDITRGQWDIGDCLELLRKSPNLVECTLAFGPDVSHQAQPLIQHEHLRILSIHSTRNKSIGPFFDNLTLSTLETFSANCSNSASWAQPQFLSLLSRSACPLLRLQLEFSFEFIDDYLIDCLQLLPSLTKLELRGQCHVALTRSFFVRLTHYMPEKGRDGCLLPNLRVLKLDIYPGKIGESFVNMIESRRCLDTNISDNALLETVALGRLFSPPAFNASTNTISRFDNATKSRLINCRNGGLDIYWTSADSKCPLEYLT